MLAAYYHVFVTAEPWSVWVRLLIGVLPTVIAAAVLIVVLLRERRKRPRA